MERKPEDIVQDIDATRARLVANLDEIADRVTPEEIARRTAAKARHGASRAYGQVRDFYIDDVSGQVRQERAVKTVAIAVALLVLRKLLK